MATEKCQIYFLNNNLIFLNIDMELRQVGFQYLSNVSSIGPLSERNRNTTTI